VRDFACGPGLEGSAHQEKIAAEIFEERFFAVLAAVEHLV
jgi:hypothetical protein